jgi:hypothetical protein
VAVFFREILQDMMRSLLLGFCMLLCASVVLGQPPRTFDWVRASDEIVQLDPTDFHTGRVYHAGPDGGNMHVIIHARQPVTLAMAWAHAWNDALVHPEMLGSIEYRCIREHVTDTTYECRLPPSSAMVLVLHDERTRDRALVQGIGAIINKRSGRPLIAPNEVQITYHSWSCVQNCVQPEYQWFLLAREKYDVSTSAKLYSMTPDHDGQRVWVKIKAKVPMTLAILPANEADRLFDKPEELSSILSRTGCKQRGVQTLEFECNVNRGDGPQSLIAVPESPVHSKKKAEIEFQTLKCIANCELIESETADNK